MAVVAVIVLEEEGEENKKKVLKLRFIKDHELCMAHGKFCFPNLGMNAFLTKKYKKIQGTSIN